MFYMFMHIAHRSLETAAFSDFLLRMSLPQDSPVPPENHEEYFAWWNEIEVNLRGPFLYANAVLPGMRTRHLRRIINVASIAGLQAIPECPPIS
jgi:NAD(P)-dependent dehydrogenase (short-subunit alcohol dehydrogenase family)